MKQRPQCRVFIAFTCVYRGGDHRHSCALRKLHGCSNVQLLDIFTVKEWRLLRDRQLLFLSPMAFHITLMWDCYWRRKLMKILIIRSQMAVDSTETQMFLGVAEPQMVRCLDGTITFLVLEPGSAIQLYSICYRNEVASSSVVDVCHYVIIRTLLDSTCFRYSCAGGKFKRTVERRLPELPINRVTMKE
jgi:hypothetical protein